MFDAMNGAEWIGSIVVTILAIGIIVVFSLVVDVMAMAIGARERPEPIRLLTGKSDAGFRKAA